MTLKNIIDNLVKAWREPRSNDVNPIKVMLFGDSHAHAVQSAIKRRRINGLDTKVEAFRLLKIKNKKSIGDMELNDFLKKIATLTPDDLVISLIGGNQHAVFATIQHPRPFDFQNDPRDEIDTSLQKEIIPSRALTGFFEAGISGRDGKTLRALREATSARVVHVIPPPPKASNDHIIRHHETIFAAERITDLGVSPPQLRLKFWRLQARLLRNFCADLGIESMPPPRGTVSDDGFLSLEYYANDATHANERYGELLLREIEELAGFTQPEAGSIS